MAKVIKPFKGCRDGELHPVDFAEGDTVEGELAEAMVAAGFAKEDAEAPKRGRGKAAEGGAD